MEKKIKTFALIGGGAKGGGGDFDYTAFAQGIGNPMAIWTGTKAEYDAISTDENTVYFIEGGGYEARPDWLWFKNESYKPATLRVLNTEPSVNVITPEFSFNGKNWFNNGDTSSDVEVVIPPKTKVYIRCKTNGWGSSEWEYNKFDCWDVKLSVGGNILSLLYGEDFNRQKALPDTSGQYTFNTIFSEMYLVDAKELVIDIDEATPYMLKEALAYNINMKSGPEYIRIDSGATGALYYMFSNCYELVGTPDIICNELAESIYEGMFNSCTSIVAAPELPATTLAPKCYMRMFEQCSSLKWLPELPATELAEECYALMFATCTSLEYTSNLLAYNVPSHAYDQMFANCIGVEWAGNINALNFSGEGNMMMMFQGCTKLVNLSYVFEPNNITPRCYQGMFMGCHSLTTDYIKINNKDIPNYACSDMYRDCRSLKKIVNIKFNQNNVGINGCYNMFYGCTNLKSIDFNLSFNNVKYKGLEQMFYRCTNLEYVLGFNIFGTISDNACVSMFQGCTSLVQAPIIGMANVPDNAFTKMFYACTSLKEVVCLAEIYNASSFDTWLYDVSEYGVFYRKPGVNWSRNASGVPATWALRDWDIQPNAIYYTTTDGAVLPPTNPDKFVDVNGTKANIVSNIYQNGVGCITFDKEVSEITGSAWYGKTRLTELWLNERLITIGGGMVEGCTSLKAIHFQSDIQAIGNSFKETPLLKYIFIENPNPPAISATTVDTVSGKCTVYVPNGAVSNYRTAENWMNIKEQIQPWVFN